MRYQQRQTTVSRSFWSFSCFFKIKFYWKSALGLFIYGLSRAAFALQQQGSTSALCWPPRDHLAAKPKTFTVWRFTKKFCQPGWLRHMFLKKKKKKERSKEIKTIEPLALVDTGRQSWNFMLLPRHWSQGHAICHVVPSWCYCRGHLFGLIAVMPQTEFARRKEKLPDSVSLR